MFEKDELPIYIAFLIVAFGMYLISGKIKESEIRKAAVKANVAYWTVDEKGFTKFHWITE
jgi:hypothetical protein